MTIGDGARDVGDLGRRRRGRVHVETWVPHDDVALHAAAIVSHGGYGTTLGLARPRRTAGGAPLFSPTNGRTRAPWSAPGPGSPSGARRERDRPRAARPQHLRRPRRGGRAGPGRSRVPARRQRAADAIRSLRPSRPRSACRGRRRIVAIVSPSRARPFRDRAPGFEALSRLRSAGRCPRGRRSAASRRWTGSGAAPVAARPSRVADSAPVRAAAVRQGTSPPPGRPGAREGPVARRGPRRSRWPSWGTP